MRLSAQGFAFYDYNRGCSAPLAGLLVRGVNAETHLQPLRTRSLPFPAGPASLVCRDSVHPAPCALVQLGSANGRHPRVIRVRGWGWGGK